MYKPASLAAGLILMTCTAPAIANEDQLEALHVARVAGMCGTIRQMSLYQNSVQAPGVDRFILQFVESESARFGIETELFLANCQRITAEFREMLEKLEENESG